MSSFAPGTDPAVMAEINRQIYGAVTPGVNQPMGNVQDYLSGTGGQGYSMANGLDAVNQAFFSQLGRAPGTEDSAYYEKLLAGGGDLRSIVSNIGNSAEALGRDRAGIADLNWGRTDPDYYVPGGGAGGTPQTTPGSYGGFNPNLGAMSDDITRRVNQSRDMGLQGIRGNAVGVGGLGGSRQGVAEGLAISGSSDNLAGQLANLNLTDWTNQQNRDLTKYGMDQGFYTAQRGQDQTGLALGANLFAQGQNGAWSPINNANNTFSPYTGFGASTNSSTSGGGAMGAVGGALGGAQFGRNNGWW